MPDVRLKYGFSAPSCDRHPFDSAFGSAQGERGKGSRRADAAVVACILGVVAAVKTAASWGGADAVDWLLAPTARLVGWLWGTPFAAEHGVGYVNTQLGYAIATACSGLNFLLAAFASLATLLATGALEARARALRIGLAAAAAYLATIVTNTVRLLVALWIHAHHPNLPLGARDTHRLLGIVLYVIALLALTLWAQRLRAKRAALEPAVLVGVGWYLAIALGLPLLHGHVVAGHVLWVSMTAVTLAAAFLLVARRVSRSA